MYGQRKYWEKPYDYMISYSSIGLVGFIPFDRLGKLNKQFTIGLGSVAFSSQNNGLLPNHGVWWASITAFGAAAMHKWKGKKTIARITNSGTAVAPGGTAGLVYMDIAASAVAAISMDLSPDRQTLAGSYTTSPFLYAVPYDINTYTAIPPLTNPAAPVAGIGTQVAWSPDGTHIAVCHPNSPFISVYPWSGAFGAKVADPATLPTGNGRGMAWSPDGTHIAIAHVNSPFMSVYPWDGSNFGAKVADPATLPAGQGNRIVWHPDGNLLALAHNSGFSVYPWDGSNFGARLTNPTVMPGSHCGGVSFSPDGKYLAVSGASVPVFCIYDLGGGNLQGQVFTSSFGGTLSGATNILTWIS